MSKLFPDDWESRMSQAEVRFCWAELESWRELNCDESEAESSDNYRAARAWKHTDVRRYMKIKQRGCCGSADFVAYRFNWWKLRYDKFYLGFNYGH